MKSTNVAIVLAALFIGVFMENLDHTIMATAVPSVVAQLGGMNVFPWVFSVYLLTSTIFIPVFGKLADQFGKKPFLLIGFSTFVLASVLSANAESIGQLIAYRALQGLGAAPLMPIAFSMIFDLVKPERQGKIQGLFAAVNGLSLILGPIIGAYLTDHFSWHWVFWINVPFGVAAAIMISLFYKEGKGHRSKGAIDYIGAALLVCAISPLMVALVMGGRDFAWASWQIITLFGVSAFFVYLFLRTEGRAKEPIIALDLFNKKVVSSVVIGALQGIVMIAVMVYIPFYIQGVMGGTVTHVGTILTHMIVAMILGTGIGGHLLEKVPARTIIWLSVVWIGIGGYMLTQIDPQTSDIYFFVAMLFMGLGLGPLFPTTTLLAQTSVSHHQTTSATSLLSFFRNIGMAVGSSLLAALVNNQLTKSASTIDTVNISSTQMDSLKDPNLLMDPALQQTVPDQALHILQHGMGTGILHVFAVSVAAALIIFLFGFMAGKSRLVMPHGSKKIGFH
ncbi:DHA2 family efflux MFS transporter permease subunit [Cohnella candidum]|nr:DHA2 family efflux MFS transporter permease subunit [Cohnella candidum]